MGFWGYWREVLRVAWRHSFDATQSVLFAVVAITGFVGWIAPPLARWDQLVNGWQAVAVVLGSIVGARLIAAPFWMSEEQTKIIKRMGRQLSLASTQPESKISLAPALGANMYWDAVPKEGSKGLLSPIMLGFDVIVTNISADPLVDCQLWVRFQPTTTDPKWLISIPWRAASAPFTLRPREQLDFPFLSSEMEANDPALGVVQFLGEGSTWRRAQNAPRMRGNLLMELECRSHNTVPATVRFTATSGGVSEPGFSPPSTMS